MNSEERLYVQKLLTEQLMQKCIAFDTAGGSDQTICAAIDETRKCQHYSATATKSKIFDEVFFIGTSSSNGLIFRMWGEEGVKFDLALKETEFFRLSAQQRREKNHIERDREKWRHMSFRRKKHWFPANMEVDIPIVHGTTPRRLRRKWQVVNFLRCE